MGEDNKPMVKLQDFVSRLEVVKTAIEYELDFNISALDEAALTRASASIELAQAFMKQAFGFNVELVLPELLKKVSDK